jgi:predicted amidohydrolase YtcJ
MKTLYYGGPILTMADERDAPEALLAEDGVIRALGAYDDFAALPGVEKVNLKGRCLMPSFIDCHSHIVMSGQYATLANLEKCATFEEIAQTLKGYMDKRGVAPGQAVVGFGYDQNFLLEQRHPDKTLLDSVSAENPIIIMHVSGHLACANSKVLALAGITAETPDPEGGVIGRMPGTREPSGYLEEAALMGLQPMLYGLMGIDPAEVIAVMQRDYIQNGITTAQDGATSPQILSLLKAAGAMHALAIDVVAYPVINACPGDVLSGNPPIDGRYANRLKLGGYKLVLDGSPQGRSAWMSKPYLGGEADYRGYPYLQDDAVNALVERAVREHKQILVHCNGDAASEQFINAYEHALAATASAEDLRPMMIHCQTVRDDQLDRMAVLNMIASIFVGHVYYWATCTSRISAPSAGTA